MGNPSEEVLAQVGGAHVGERDVNSVGKPVSWAFPLTRNFSYGLISFNWQEMQACGKRCLESI